MERIHPIRKIKWNRTGAMILCLIFTFLAVSCTGNTGTGSESKPAGKDQSNAADAVQAAGSGAYVESSLDLTGYTDIRGLTVYGNALCFSAKSKALDGNRHIFRYENGKIDLFPNTPAITDTVMGMTVNRQGNPVILTIKGEYVPSETGDPPPVTLSVLTNGTFKAFGHPISNLYLSYKLFQLENGEFLLGSTKGILHLDAQGKLKSTIGNGSITLEAGLSGKSLYTLTQQPSNKISLTAYDIKTEKSIKEMPLPTDKEMDQPLLTSDAKGSIYIGLKDGIFRLTAAGEKYEQLAEGMSTILGDSTLFASDMLVSDTGDIFIYRSQYGQTGEIPSIYRYSWSESAAAAPRYKISIASVFDYSSLRSTISDYQRAHSEVRISYQSYLPGYMNSVGDRSLDELGELQVKLEDAVRSINTDVLSGNVPDILLLDGLPIQNYIEKGIPDDMTKWAGSRLTDGTWVGNIAGSYRQKDGQLPCVPTYFSVPVLWGDKPLAESIKTLSDLTSLKNKLPDGQFALTATASELFTMLYPLSAPDWMNSKGRIDFTSANFKSFLEQLKEIIQTIPVLPMVKDVTGTEYVDGSAYMNNYMAKKSAFYMTLLDSPDLVDYGNSLTHGRNQTSGVSVLPGQSGKKVFYPSQILSVCAGSKNKEAAYAFLDYLLSSGLSETRKNYETYSIDKASLDQMLAPSGSEENDAEKSHYSSLFKLKIPKAPVDEALSQHLKDIVYGLDTPVTVDYTLLKMMLEEIIPYLSEQKTLDQTITSLTSRTRAYLAE